MGSSQHNSRPWRSVLLLTTLAGVIVLFATVKWIGLDLKRNNSQQAATLPKVPPILVEDRHYEECGHSIEENRELSAELRLLSPKELAQIYNASTYQVSEERVRIFSQQPGICPQCKEHIFVGIDGDEVAVFYGLPGGPRQLRERTLIQAERLPLQAVADLKRGIPVANQEELLHVLEGLMN